VAVGPARAGGTLRVGSLGSGSLPAIKAFLRGSQYFRRTQWDSASASFKEAVSLDSTFGIAYLHLAQAAGWMKGAGNAEATDANKKAGQFVRPGLSTRDSLFLTAVGHYALAGRSNARNTSEANKAIATMQAAVDRYPDDPEAWYLLGDMRYHADVTITDREALGYFDRAIAADSDFAPAYIHAIELAYRYGADAGRRYADAYLRRDPRDFEGEGIRLAALAADPRTRREQLQLELDTLPERAVQKAYSAMSRLPDTAEATIRLLSGSAHRAITAGSKRAVTNLLSSQLSMHGHIDSAWKIAVTNRNYLIAEIAGLGLVPAESASKALRPLLSAHDDAFLFPIPWLALMHDTTTLASTTATVERSMKKDTALVRRGVVAYLLQTLQAYTALARGDTATATRVFEALPDTIVNIPFDDFVRARLIGKQDPRRAIALLERHNGLPDLLYPARELERGRLAERIGDKERAIDAYSFVATVWSKADSAPLRDAAKEASDALQRLDSDGRVRAQLVPGSNKR
jgi:tetratricopeptide (TPR) repeat protein